MAIKRGTSFADRLDGTSGADVLEGLAGNDQLFGFGGDDLLFGGADHDTLDGGTGNDEMHGGTGNDTYHVDSGGDKVVEAAGAGFDHVIASVDVMLAANIEKLTLTGSATLAFGNVINNTIAGNANDNLLAGGGGNDTVRGFGGDDDLEGNGGSDSIFGGDGNDRIAGGDQFVNFSDDGVDGDDFLMGEGGSDLLEGGSGNDFLDGGTGIDMSFGNAGVDTIELDLADLTQGGVRIHGHHDGVRVVDPHDNDELLFAGGQFLDLTGVADDKIKSIEKLNLLVGDNAVRFTRSDVVAMSDDDDLVIVGGIGDSVTSIGQGWGHLADTVIGGRAFEHYAKDGVDVFVASEITQAFS